MRHFQVGDKFRCDLIVVPVDIVGAIIESPQGDTWVYDPNRNHNWKWLCGGWGSDQIFRPWSSDASWKLVYYPCTPINFCQLGVV